MNIGSGCCCRYPSSKCRSSIAHTHTQSPSHQNLGVPKLSGLPVPKVLATLLATSGHTKEDFTVDRAQHIKTNLVPKPRRVSSTRITPCFCSFTQHPGDVTVRVADAVQAGERGDGNISVLPTQRLAYTSSTDSLCACLTRLHQ